MFIFKMPDEHFLAPMGFPAAQFRRTVRERVIARNSSFAYKGAPSMKRVKADTAAFMLVAEAPMDRMYS